MGLLLKYHEYNMNYDILSYKYPYIYLLTTLQWNILHQKDHCRPSRERPKLYTDNDFPSVKYNPGVSCRG